MGTTEIVQALVSPAEKLIEAVSGAIGKAYEPKHIRKIAKRASSRLAYQEITKQQNIEAVVDNAYEELEHAENVSSESVNSDWMFRFLIRLKILAMKICKNMGTYFGWRNKATQYIFFSYIRKT